MKKFLALALLACALLAVSVAPSEASPRRGRGRVRVRLINRTAVRRPAVVLVAQRRRGVRVRVRGRRVAPLRRMAPRRR
jgi:hypothetical protein